MQLACNPERTVTHRAPIRPTLAAEIKRAVAVSSALASASASRINQAPNPTAQDNLVFNTCRDRGGAYHECLN